MGNRQISITEFSAYAEEELKAVEHGNTLVELIRDGEIVAYLSPAPKPHGHSGTLADWIGTGAGITLAPGFSLDDPAFEPEEFPGSED